MLTTFLITISTVKKIVFRENPFKVCSATTENLLKKFCIVQKTCLMNLQYFS